MNLMRYLYFLFFMLVIPLRAQQLHIQVALDTNQFLIGDQLYLTLNMEYSKEISGSLPFLPDTVFKIVEVLDSFSIDSVVLHDKIKLSRRFLITSFDSGMHIIPELPFIFTFQGITDTMTSMPFVFNVHTMNVDTATTILDIKPPINTPLNFKEVLPYLYIGFGVLLLIVAIVFFILYKTKKKVFFFEKPVEPPHRIALRELDLLKDEKLWQKSEYKIYYSRLTDIIRQYIEARFLINAMEQTTDETIDAFERTKLLDRATFEQLQWLLQTADLAKFAKQIPLPDENDKSMKIAYHIVLSTKPNEMEGTDNGNAAV
jgi:hypothetical protein